MPDIEPEADDGVFRKTRFAPLSVTGFSNKGWRNSDLRRGGSMVVDSKGFKSARADRASSEVDKDVMRLTNENFKLTTRLNEL